MRYGLGMEMAGALLRKAREGAGLSQAALAARAGTTQSVVSAYENGRRQPTIPTLTRLIDAAGGSLRLSVVRHESPAGGGKLRQLVERHRHEIKRLATSHRLTKVRLFGSATRGDDGTDSDIDLLVHPMRGASLLSLIGFEQAVGDLLGVDVDVVSDREPNSRQLAAVAREAIPL
jgi:predicted nucleotidyltransferase/DNA-binding XRE family transcriptional regulator